MVVIVYNVYWRLFKVNEVLIRGLSLGRGLVKGNIKEC